MRPFPIDPQWEEGEFEFRIELGSICREISIVGTLLDHNHVGNYNCIVLPRTVQ